MQWGHQTATQQTRYNILKIVLDTKCTNFDNCLNIRNYLKQFVFHVHLCLEIMLSSTMQAMFYLYKALIKQFVQPAFDEV